MGLHASLLLCRHEDLGSRASDLDKAEAMPPVDALNFSKTLDLIVLILVTAIASDLLLKLGHLDVAGVQEVLLLRELFGNSLVVLLELLGVETGVSDVVEHDDESDDVKFLLVDTGLVEHPLLHEGQETLFSSKLDFDDVVLDLFEVELPCLSLLLLEIDFLLFELLELLLFFVVHIFFGLVHPFFSDEFLLHQVLVLLQDQVESSHHLFKTTGTNIITSGSSLSLGENTLLLLLDGSFFLGEVPLNLNFLIRDVEDVAGVFEDRRDMLRNFFLLLQFLKKLFNLLVLLLD